MANRLALTSTISVKIVLKFFIHFSKTGRTGNLFLVLILSCNSSIFKHMLTSKELCSLGPELQCLLKVKEDLS